MTLEISNDYGKILPLSVVINALSFIDYFYKISMVQ
ncbi:hypothetical protein Q556_02047, partial [Staphylococcus aureus M1501]